MSKVTIATVLAAIATKLPLSAADQADIQSQIAQLETDAGTALGNIGTDAAAAVPAVEADVGKVAEVAADAVITHAVGPFAGVIVPAANMLLERAGGSLVTAVSHLIAAAEANFGVKAASATVTTSASTTTQIAEGVPATPVTVTTAPASPQ